MRSLFRGFDAGRVEHLVISGQASVLYGGAFFSQDLDLWIRPTQANARRLLKALARLRARVHKLTPPLSSGNLRRGHGFHFLVPQRGAPDLYLDVMGQPPRVGGFGDALRRAEHMDTPWGRLAVVSLEDLVELKKTNRPSDYEVITRLVMVRLGREPSPASAMLAWAGSGNLYWTPVEVLTRQQEAAILGAGQWGQDTDCEGAGTFCPVGTSPFPPAPCPPGTPLWGYCTAAGGQVWCNDPTNEDMVCSLPKPGFGWACTVIAPKDCNSMITICGLTGTCATSGGSGPNPTLCGTVTKCKN